MHVFISVDIEGIADVTSWWDEKEKAREEVACRRMTLETNAAIEGALAAGARKVTVADSHGWMRNILPELLHPKATLVRGRYRPLGMMQGVEKRVDAAMLVGYHAMAGTPTAILPHSYALPIRHLWINNVRLGEIGINARIAGQYGVPIVLVTGDTATAREVKAQLPKTHTVAVKDAMGFLCAANDHPEIAQEKIRKAAEAALADVRKIKPVVVKSPRVRIELATVMQTDLVMTIPGTVRLDGYTFEYRAANMAEMYRTLRAVQYLAKSAKW